MSDNRFDNSDWQLGMPLPSRKQTHSRKKKGKEPATESAVAQDPRRELKLQPQREFTLEPEKKPLRESARELDLKPQPQSRPDMQQSQLETEHALHLQQTPSQEEPAANHAVVTAELAQAAVEEATATALPRGGVTAEERDMLWGEDEDEDGPILTIWQRLLLFVLVPVVLLGILVWGKIAYVHHVPDLVRNNVPAYSSGEGFLVVKPWWFGPPIYHLDSYPPADDFTMYQIKMGDHAPLVEEPFVLWSFQQDILN